MAASVSYSIQLAVQGLLQAETFPDIPAANILVRKLPIAQEKLTINPSILIAPYGEQDWSPLDFEGGSENIYRVEICLVSVNSLDMATDQDKHQGWQELARRAILRQGLNHHDFRCKLDSVPSVWDINEESSPTFDRAKLNQMYDYNSLVIRFHSNERNN